MKLKSKLKLSDMYAYVNLLHYKVTSDSGANLDPTGQCDLTFRLGNKQFTHMFTILQDICRNIILGLNWQCNCRIVSNWKINNQQHITHNKKFLYTSIPSSNAEPITFNSGSVMLPPRSVSLISVKAPTELNTRHLCQLRQLTI